MPFPEVLQEHRGSPREISAVYRHETNESARLKLDTVSNSSSSGAVSNEKRARTAVPDTYQVPQPSSRERDPEASDQLCAQPIRSAQDNGFSNRVHALSPHIVP